MSALFLGCDGGGTKTALAVVTGDGEVLATQQAPTTYYLDSDIDLVGDVLGAAVPAVCAAAGTTVADLGFAFLGLPGHGEVRADVPRLDAIVAGVLGHDRFACDNDMVCGWAGSLACADGINVISGTGSMAYGRRGDAGARVGGWGEAFGDEGSGHWLGVGALSAFSRMSDGRAPRGPLYELLRERLDVREDVDVIDLVLHRWRGARAPIAALSRVVGEAAAAGDALAAALLREAAGELVALVDATRRRLGFAPAEQVPVSYSGGVFAMSEVLDAFRAGLDAVDADYVVREPLLAPELGAALYAARLAGAAFDDEALSTLRASGASVRKNRPA